MDLKNSWTFSAQENSAVGEINAHKEVRKAYCTVSSGMVCHRRICYLRFVSQWKKASTFFYMSKKRKSHVGLLHLKYLSLKKKFKK